VFGIQIAFTEFYDTDITVASNGTFIFNNAPLTQSNIQEQLMGGYAVATIGQLREAATAGMQCYKWGVCLSDDNQTITGAFPTQTCIDQSKCTYSSDLSPRVVTVTTGAPFGKNLPDVIWVYGMKPLKQDTSPNIFVNIDSKNYTILDWMTPFAGATSNSLLKKFWSKNDSGAQTACGANLSNCAINIVATGGTNVNAGFVIDSYVDYKQTANNSLPSSKPPTPGNPSFAWIANKSSSLNLKFRFTNDGYIVSQQPDGSVYALSILSTFDMCPVQLVYFNSIADIQTQPDDDTNSADPYKVKVTGATKFLLTNEGNLIMRDHPEWGVCWGNPPYAGIPLYYGGLHIRKPKGLWTKFFI
jgi:hypothetical protein